METALIKPFADGEYRFWLPMPRVIAAEREMSRDRERPRSIFGLFYDLGEALASNLGQLVLAGPTSATINECQSVIRNALCGGDEGTVNGETIAVGDAMAQELLQTYCYPARPAMHDVALAWDILKAAIYGVEIPEGSKKKAAKTEIPLPS